MKAQIKMFETIAVLVVFFFLLGMGLTFYASAQRAEVASLKSRQFEQQAVQTAARSMAMPELDCSYAAVRTPNCFDRNKLDAFGQLVTDVDALTSYATVFGFANITVREVYPGSASWQLFVNAPPARQQGGTELVQLPVLLHDPQRETNSFGVLEVRVYALI